MLTIQQIKKIKVAHDDTYDSYEDFAYRNYFQNDYTSSFIKPNSRFDDYFSSMDYRYNQAPRAYYIIQQAMVDFKKIHTTLDFNNFEEVKELLYKTNAIKELIGVLGTLTSSSIKKDLTQNFKNWAIIADNYGVDISDKLLKIEPLFNSIKQDDVFTPLLSRIEKIQLDLYNLSNAYSYVDPAKPDAADLSAYHESCFNLKRSVSFLEKHYSQVDLLKNLINESHVFDYINEYRTIREEIIETLIKNNTDFSYSHAHEYVELMKNAGTVELMLLDRADSDLNVVHHINEVYKFNDSASVVSQLNIFTDNSIAVKKRDGSWVNMNSKVVKDSLIENILQRELALHLKKSPTIAKMFVNKLKEDFVECERAFTAANTYLEHEAILKSKDYNLLGEIDELLFEELDDSMNAFVRNHKIHQYGLSISSKKYQHLYNDESFKVLELLYDLKIPASELQESLGKKLAAFKSSEDFNKSLKQLYSIHNGFNSESVLKKANAVNAEVVKNDDNMVIIKIENFQQSSATGSSSWCIVRDEVHFKSYKEDTHQYFIYDFNKDPVENNSIVGITLNKDGTHSAAHFKNDDQLYDNDEFKKLQIDIVKHDLKSYPFLNKTVQADLDNSKESKKNGLLKNITSRLFNR